MKFSCNQAQINAAVQSVAKIASFKSPIRTQNAILFDATKDKLKLVATDGKNAIETIVESNIAQPGIVLLPASFLTELLRKMPMAEIHFELDDTGNMKISSGKIEYTIMSYSSSEFRDIEREHFEHKVVLSAEELVKSIDQVKFAVAKDENRVVLTGALFEFKKEGLNMVTIDGFRMALKRIPMANEFERNIVVTEKALSEVQRLVASEQSVEQIDLYISDKQVVFQIGNSKLISNLIAGEFINYEKIIPSELKSEFVVDAKEFESAISRSSIIVNEEKSKVVKFEVTDDVLRITSDSQSGRANEEIGIKLEGDDITIGFNPKFILESLKVMDSETLTIRMTTSVGPCLIEPTEREDYMYLLLPVRL